MGRNIGECVATDKLSSHLVTTITKASRTFASHARLVEAGLLPVPSGVDISLHTNVGSQVEALSHTVVNYRWRREGDGGYGSYIPRALSNSLVKNYNTLISDRFIEDGSFLRLNYLQLSYSFDSSLIKKWHLNQLKLYASARNLFCLTKYSGVDPEVAYGGMSISIDGASTPAHARAYTIGVNIEF